MRGVRILVSCVLLAVPACESAGLSGVWTWAGNRNPGGYNISLYLGVAGHSVSGKALFGGFVGAPADSAPITGVVWGPSFRLSFTQYGRLNTYAGQLVSENELSGTVIVAPDSAGQLPDTSRAVVFWRH